MTFPPVDTERLTVRTVEIGDVESLHQRRNHPDAARYQDWEFPFPLDAARRLIAEVAATGAPADREWWMGTIVEAASGTDVGDVAVRLDSAGRAATIGYSLHPDHWGRGFATEAVGGLVDRLIDDGVRRFVATIHPDNLASMRVVERLGFAYEGRTVASWFEGDGPDAPTTDDLLFGLTATMRAEWLARPTGRPALVELIEIDDTNQRAVARLRTHYSQEHLVATVADSYGDALFPELYDGARVKPWMRAIAIADEPEGGDDNNAHEPEGGGDNNNAHEPEGDGDDNNADEPEGGGDNNNADQPEGGGLTLAGFVMLAVPTRPDDEPYLWRLLIDRRYQRRGIASAVLDRIEGDLRAEGHPAIWVHWEPGAGSPEPFYLARGYEPTGAMEGTEIEGRKPLTPPEDAAPG
ncbi:MAG: GNAT family N-acetyltransferase [Actinomycetota bacterium]